MKSSKAIKIAWGICLAVMAVVAGLMFFCPQFKVAKGPNQDADILQIQFSCSAEELCRAFSGDNTTLYNNLRLDFGFILCYTLLFYLSIRVILALFKTGRFRFTWLCLLPGLFDVAENMFMLPLVNCGGCKTGIAGFDLFFYAVRAKWLTAVPFAVVTGVIALYLLLEFFDRLLSKET
jgi:hypothetical protein